MNNILNNIKLNKKYIIFLFVFLILFFLISGYLEYRSRRKNVLKLMRQTSQNVTGTIKQASKNSLLSYDYLNSQTKKNMLSTLEIIDHQDSCSGITSGFVNQVKKNSNLKNIKVIDKNKTFIYPQSSPSELNISESVNNFLNSNRYFRLLNRSSDDYIVQALLRRNQGGVIIGEFNVQEMVEFNRERGIGRFLNNAVTDSSVLYIAIQNKQGIMAASQKVDSLSSINYDSFLEEVLKERKFNYRFSRFRGQKIYEAALPFSILDRYNGIIRIGLDITPIQNVQEAALWDVFVRLLGLTILGFIVLSYTMSRNTVETLQKEKERITEEVYELQRDLREKEKQNAIHHLASGVAHEIGNPLNALSLTVQRLKRKITSDNKEIQEMMDLIKNEVNRIDKIIQKFLNFSKPIPLDKKETNLTELTDEVLTLYKDKLEQHDINLSRNYDQNYYLPVDQEKMKQCFINLLENAIDAVEGNEEKKIDIDMRKQNGQVEVDISDNGCGIDENTLSKIFNLYFSTKDNGTGIGLSKVYKIIKNHDGDISVDSEPGEGTTFLIKLPATE